MRIIQPKFILVCFWMSLVLSGCSRSGEILYFDREEAGNEYVRELGGDVELPSRKELPEEEPEFRQEALRQICVHVCGQVCRPGIVMLPEGSRAWEAVEAAGGLSGEAHEAAVNLAAVLRDGEKLYIPALGEELADDAENRGLVNLNTADSAGLQTLPGIGESRAADILSYREKHGGFRAVDEIMQVPGIKESTYEKIRDQITVN